MCLVPAIHHWGIIQVRPSRGMVLEVQMSHVAQILPRVFRKQHRRPCLWKIRVSHPKTEVPLKASGSFSREELHLCHARVSVHRQRTDSSTPVLGAAEAGSQAGPPHSAALGAPSRCSQPGFQLFPSCCPQQGWEAVGAGPDQPPLLSWPHPPSWSGVGTGCCCCLWAVSSLADKKSACSSPAPANLSGSARLAVCFPPRTGWSWFHALGSRKSQASS